MKILLEGLSCSTRVDGRTDMTTLIVTFRNFTNAPKMILKMILF